MQSCWMKLDAFPEIAADLRRMYDRGVHLTYNNNGVINMDVQENALVYVLGEQVREKSNKFKIK